MKVTSIKGRTARLEERGVGGKTEAFEDRQRCWRTDRDVGNRKYVMKNGQWS